MTWSHFLTSLLRGLEPKGLGGKVILDSTQFLCGLLLGVFCFVLFCFVFCFFLS